MLHEPEESFSVFSDRKEVSMSNYGYDSSNHYSNCTGPNCDCDERRYGSHSSSGGDWILLILALFFSVVFPPLGFVFFFFFML